jgi:hypothetical protein
MYCSELSTGAEDTVKTQQTEKTQCVCSELSTGAEDMVKTQQSEKTQCVLE